MYAPQIDSISAFVRNPNKLLDAAREDGPVHLTQHGREAAVVLSPEHWRKIVDGMKAMQEEIELLEDTVGVYKTKLALATGEDEIIRIEPGSWEEIPRDEKVLA